MFLEYTYASTPYYNTLDERVGMVNAIKRYASYKYWTWLRDGYLGRGMLVPVDSCVANETAIRFPQENGEMETGFRPNNDQS